MPADSADRAPTHLTDVMASAYRFIGQAIYSTYAHGVREGLEGAAVICQANLDAINADGFHPVPVDVITSLRDQIRVGALNVADPVYVLPGDES